MSDELGRLLARCSTGDNAALEALYRQTSPTLNGVAYRIVGTQTLAAEVLQEAFIQIWQQAGSYQNHLSQPMTWMTSIVRYRALDKLKHERRQAIPSEEIDQMTTDSSAPAPDQTLAESVNQDLASRLTICLERLERLQRRSVLLSYYYGFSHREISTKLKKPLGTVKSWIRNSIDKLQQCLR